MKINLSGQTIAGIKELQEQAESIEFAFRTIEDYIIDEELVCEDPYKTLKALRELRFIKMCINDII